jgi:hypothetical protein
MIGMLAMLAMLAPIIQAQEVVAPKNEGGWVLN